MDLMQQIAYFLPHLLALSTSSPFWRGEVTGLKCYRLSVFQELPRTGLPESFDSFGEYQRHLDVMVRAGLLEDGSKIWWDVRPSARFPTLEMRIRSEEHTSELQSLMRISYAVFCLKKKKQNINDCQHDQSSAR